MKIKKFPLLFSTVFSAFLLFLVAGTGTRPAQASSTAKIVKKINKANKKALRSYRIKEQLHFNLNGRRVKVTETAISNAKTGKVTLVENGKKTHAWISNRYDT